MKDKELIKTFFLFLVVILMVFPLFLTFNAFLTRLVERFSLYVLLQTFLVPIEQRLIGLLVAPFVHQYASSGHMLIVNGVRLEITWNCLGWQSLLLFFSSLVIGLKGTSYTFWSKVQVIFLGIFGVFWINIFRMSFTALLAAYSMPIFKLVFHDYLAVLVTIGYLLLFWWFAYRFVLEGKNRQLPEA
jgi:exosortase/archaeosortase family protein